MYIIKYLTFYQRKKNAIIFTIICNEISFLYRYLYLKVIHVCGMYYGVEYKKINYKTEL